MGREDGRCWTAHAEDGSLTTSGGPPVAAVGWGQVSHALEWHVIQISKLTKFGPLGSLGSSKSGFLFIRIFPPYMYSSWFSI